MKYIPKPNVLTASAFSVLAMSVIVALAANAPRQTKNGQSAPALPVPLALGQPIPLAVRSSGVEWKGSTYYLVRLSSIQFKLNKTNQLQANIEAEVTSFDEVTYDVSCAVFDAAGQMLGAARAQCDVQRTWIGTVLHGARTISLDFGVSLDYTRATGFMISISNRKVLTPDDWQR